MAEEKKTVKRETKKSVIVLRGLVDFDGNQHKPDDKVKLSDKCYKHFKECGAVKDDF